MTELQKFIIRNISKEINKEKIESIKEEYKEIYGTDLDKDCRIWKDKFSRIVSNSRRIK